jgi:hypothetical protein
VRVHIGLLRTQARETILFASETVLKKSSPTKDPGQTTGFNHAAGEILSGSEAILKSNSRVHRDGPARVVSTSPHVPVKQPASK